MSETLSSDSHPWRLLAVIRVDEADRVQCQCGGCGQRIYAAIHMVQLLGGEIQCWGSDCYAREAGLAQGRRAAPLYPGIDGRKLTEAERELLRTSRERLIAAFKAEHDEKLRQQEEARLAAEVRNAQAEEISIRPLPEGRARLPSLKPPSVDYTRPDAAEPMHDSLYREIRQKKIEDWRRQGIDLTKLVHFKSLIENCLRDYERSR